MSGFYPGGSGKNAHTCPRYLRMSHPLSGQWQLTEAKSLIREALNV